MEKNFFDGRWALPLSGLGTAAPLVGQVVGELEQRELSLMSHIALSEIMPKYIQICFVCGPS